MRLQSGRYADELLPQNWNVVISTNEKRTVVAISASRVSDRYGQTAGFVMVMRDVTTRQRTAEHMEFLATHDELTGLPDRRLFYDRLTQSMVRARRYGGNMALKTVDVDRFKQINDSLGHEAGDDVLRQVARRLSSSMRESDTVARFGGHEFMIIAPDLPSVDLVDRIASRLVKAASVPIDVGGEPRVVTLSIGIALFPRDAARRDDLVACADRAPVRDQGAGTQRLLLLGASHVTQGHRAMDRPAR